MATCLVIQHVEPEGPYEIATALRSVDVDVDVRRVFLDEQLPADLEGFDGLVVMGGPMSVTSDDGFSTRRHEMHLCASAVDSGVPTLGVCLGAQLLARALGARVYAGEAGPEIGFAPVHVSEAARDDPLLHGFDGEQLVLHWHGDTFDCPAGAVLLGSNDYYANQVFRAGSAAWGFQFHFEVSVTAVKAFVATFAGEIARAGLDAKDIVDATPMALHQLAPLQSAITTRFAQLVHDRDLANWRP